MIKKTLRALVRDDRGATALEYGLLVALIALAALTSMSALAKSKEFGFEGALQKISAAIDAII
ncbi:MAG: Flp family type IVb pilin [Novosphingobium sp.]|uniref:Flp family type IVb pilin n=1 Tax=Novosphingobium sp. TaxID=1874826 RepID=UPI0017A20D0C|nr:Flp family type IVb pilin [Novosphingobium sp.]